MADVGRHRAVSGRRDHAALLRFYRILAFVGAVGVLSFYWIHHAAVPDAVDPFWQRATVAGVCLVVFAATWFARPGHVVLLAYVAYYVLTLWIVELLVLNQMAHEYAIALIVVAAGIAGTFQDKRHLLYYLGVTFGAMVLAALLVEQPQTNLLVYLTYALMMAVLTYVAVNARLDLDLRRMLSERRFALAARGAHDGLWEWDLVTGRVNYSQRWAEMLELEHGSLGHDPEEWLGRVDPEDVARVRTELIPVEGRDEVETEYRIRTGSGGWRWMQARAAVERDAEGTPRRLAGSQSDVTEQHRAEEQLVHETLHDALTGLPNRVLLMDRLERLLASARRHHEMGFAVIFIDLDRFKRVNDSLGPTAGDAVLVEMAQRIQGSLRDEDTLARVGGDEFVVVAPPYTDREDAVRVANRLQAAIRRPLELGDQTLHLTASVGIALAPAGYRSPVELVRDADIAMYRAKQGRLGQPQMFDREMHQQALQTLRLENELREAIHGSQLVLHYQPIVRLDTRRIDGFEALVRWEHPERGMLPPSEFLPLAEETGLIVDLGRWALREACRAQRRWREAGGRPVPQVHVNLSGSHFLAGSLLEDVSAALGDGGEGARLGIEITENVLLTDPGATADLLLQLRERGIGVAIDDFGTGYSSLRYLHALPADSLKIDRSFVQRCDDRAGAELIRTIVLLAGRLGMSTVAEGIETSDVADRILAGGATHGQGFLFSPAMAEAEAARLIAAERLPAT